MSSSKTTTKDFLKLLGSKHLFHAYDYHKKLPAKSNIRDIEDLKALNEQGYCIFFGVNAMRHNTRNNDNTIAVRVIWSDDDRNYTNKKTGERIKADKHPEGYLLSKPKLDKGDFPLPPSIVVQTSAGKYQYYWLTKTKEFKQFSLVMQTMTDHHGNDTGVTDLARVLRLPGFNHNKDLDNPFSVKVVGGNHKQYDWKVITTAFPPAEHLKSSTKKKGKYNKKKARKAIKKSEDFHGSLRDRAMELANKKLDTQEIISLLETDMMQVPKKNRDKRWHDRISEDHLFECAISAVNKIGSETNGNATNEEEAEIEKLEVKERKKTTSHTEFTKKLVDDIIAPKDTVIGELTRALYKTWWVPNIMVAGLTARSIVAYLGGGKYKSSSGDRMAIQQIAVGETCSGKDLLISGPKEVIEKSFNGSQLKRALHNVIDEVGSAEGVDLKLRTNGKKHDVLMLLDEIGGLYKSAQKDPNKMQFLSFLLKMYTKSNQTLTTRALMKNLPEGAASTLYAPHSILSGATTPKLIVDGIGIDNVQHGSFSRTGMFPVDAYTEDVVEDIEELKLSDKVIKNLKAAYLQKNDGLSIYPNRRIKNPVICEIEKEAKKLSHKVALKNQKRKAGLTRDIWNRQNTNAKMYAQIEAVAENPDRPVITLEIMERNLEFTAYACEFSVWLFANEVAENPHELAKKKILRYMQRKVSSQKGGDRNIVLLRSINNHPVMRELKDNKWKVLKELVDERKIELIEKENIRGASTKAYKLI